jgi:hypothetical protein
VRPWRLCYNDLLVVAWGRDQEPEDDIMAQVAVKLSADAEFVVAELVEVKGSWATVTVDGETHKVRKSALALNDDANPDESALEDLLTDEDELSDDAEVKSGDVFPKGIRETYVKGVTETGRSFIDCGDELATQLRDATLEEVAKRAEQVLGQRTAKGWIALYTTDREAVGKAALNPGMVRMNLGNRIRAAIKKQEEEAAKA